MSRPLFVLRPEPGWSATAAAAAQGGVDVRGEPLFEIEPVAWETVDPADFDGLLLGSANALRCAGPDLDALRSLPVHAVGTTTAEMARQAGFNVAATGSGGLQGVIDAIPAPARLLRLAGEAHVPLTYPPGVTAVTRIVYRSALRKLSPAVLDELTRGGVVALHSAEAALAFAAQIDAAGVGRSALAIAALGPRIAEAAGQGWQAIHIAERPDEAALLALARRMCHSPGQGAS